MQGRTIYDDESKEVTGSALRTGIPGARGSDSFCPAYKIGPPPKHKATLQFLGYIVFGAPKFCVSLSALDYVDGMGRTLGRFYQYGTRLKTFGN
jgi:hypothetical protein